MFHQAGLDTISIEAEGPMGLRWALPRVQAISSPELFKLNLDLFVIFGVIFS